MDRIKNFLTKNTTVKQTVLKNTFWMGASTTLIKIFRAGIIIYAARLLGTEQYGVFTYAMSIAALFAVFSDMGLSSILVRELSKNTDRQKEYFSTALVIKLGFLSVMAVLILGIVPLFSQFEVSTTLMPIIALSIVFESLRGFLYSIPRAQNNMQREAGISIVTEICCIALIIGVFLKHPSPHSLAYSFMIGNALGFLIALFSVRAYIIQAKQYFVRALVKPLIKLILPFAILSVFGIFMTNIDSVIIGFFGTEHMLGLYGAAQRPLNILYIIPGFLSISLLPIMSRLIKEEKKSTVATLLTSSSSAALSLALPIALGGIVVAGPLISVIFGSSYIGAVATFQILLITVLFVFPGTIFAEVLLAENKQKIFLFTGITGAILNIGLDLLLIPSHGIVGSAIATVIAQLFVNTCFYIEAKKTYPIRLWSGIYKSIFATLVMTFVAYLLTSIACPLLIILPVSAVLYIGLLLLMKDKNILVLRQLFKK